MALCEKNIFYFLEKLLALAESWQRKDDDGAKLKNCCRVTTHISVTSPVKLLAQPDVLCLDIELHALILRIFWMSCNIQNNALSF